MKPATVKALVADFRRRAAAAGQNLSAEAAWHSAADLLEDAAKQDRHAARPRRRKLGLRLSR